MIEAAFGSEKLRGDAGIALVRLAYALGYRTFDTALAYGNQTLLAEALRGCGDVRLVSKITRSHVESLSVRGAVEQTLSELRVEVLDTMLVHAPKGIAHQQVFSQLRDLQKEGKILRCGLSNYTKKHLERLAAVDIVPDVLQVEMHPFLQEEALMAYCHQQNIEIMAHSALAGGRVFKDLTLCRMAQTLDRSVAQLVFAWCRARGAIPVASTLKEAHIYQNRPCKALELTSEAMVTLQACEANLRLCNGPAWAEFT